MMSEIYHPFFYTTFADLQLSLQLSCKAEYSSNGL